MSDCQELSTRALANMMMMIVASHTGGTSVCTGAFLRLSGIGPFTPGVSTPLAVAVGHGDGSDHGQLPAVPSFANVFHESEGEKHHPQRADLRMAEYTQLHTSSDANLAERGRPVEIAENLPSLRLAATADVSCAMYTRVNRGIEPDSGREQWLVAQ